MVVSGHSPSDDDGEKVYLAIFSRSSGSTLPSQPSRRCTLLPKLSMLFVWLFLDNPQRLTDRKMLFVWLFLDNPQRLTDRKMLFVWLFLDNPQRLTERKAGLYRCARLPLLNGLHVLEGV